MKTITLTIGNGDSAVSERVVIRLTDHEAVNAFSIDERLQSALSGWVIEPGDVIKIGTITEA